MTEPTNAELLAAVRAAMTVDADTIIERRHRAGWAAIDTLTARLEAAERNAESNGENWRLETKRRMEAEHEVERLRRALEQISGVRLQTGPIDELRSCHNARVIMQNLARAALAEEK